MVYILVAALLWIWACGSLVCWAWDRSYSIEKGGPHTFTRVSLFIWPLLVTWATVTHAVDWMVKR